MVSGDIGQTVFSQQGAELCACMYSVPLLSGGRREEVLLRTRRSLCADSSDHLVCSATRRINTEAEVTSWSIPIQHLVSSCSPVKVQHLKRFPLPGSEVCARGEGSVWSCAPPSDTRSAGLVASFSQSLLPP